MVRKGRRRRVFKPFKRGTRPGAAAGAIEPQEGAEKPVLDLFCYDEHHLHRRKEVSLKDVETARGTARVVWLNIHGLGDASVVRRIGELFGLHVLALEDVVNVHQRAKVEEFEGFLFVVARMIDRDQQHDLLETEQLSIFVGRNFLVTFQEKSGDYFNVVRNRLKGSDARLRVRGTDFLAYSLLDSVVDAYFKPLERIEKFALICENCITRKLANEPTR